MDTAADVQPILNRWARIALVVPQDQRAALQFEPSAVRALLGEHSRLLVVLDNVWSLPAIRPLRDALPPGAHLVITTRSRTVLFDLGGARYEVHELTPADARALIALRLGWSTVPPTEQDWCDTLAEGVGRHTLALDVALGLLLREGEQPDMWRVTADRVVTYVHAGHGFEDLHLDDADDEHNVRLVLSYSYARMDAEAQRRFRWLGVFAPDESWETSAVAAVWRCSEAVAKQQLDAFVNAALLTRSNMRWQQHSLLRGYALALLQRSGEYEHAAARHADYYHDAMRRADAAGQYYTMLPDYPQVRHAFAWTIDNDLQQAQNLIGHSATLQAAFGADRDWLGWCEQALRVTQRRGTAADVARAQGSLGNAHAH